MVGEAGAKQEGRPTKSLADRSSSPAGPFLGKWSFGQGSDAIVVDVKNGSLSVAAAPSDDSDRLNAYGEDARFALQAANGLYVASDGDGYKADKAPTDTINLFTLETASGGTRIVDLGPSGSGGQQYYLDNSSGVLKRIAKAADPPATTEFAQTKVTPGLSEILAGADLGINPDFRWVNMSGTDFTKATGVITFGEAKFDDADLSDCIFNKKISFAHSTAQRINFRNTVLDNCDVGSCDFTDADFTDASCTYISADRCIFTKAKMARADFRHCLNLQDTKFDHAELPDAKFDNCANIVDTDFTSANLTGVVFDGSSVTGPMVLNGATLVGGSISNPKEKSKITIYPGFIEADANTNFTGCALRYIDFSKYDFSQFIFNKADLTGCNFAGCKMISTELAYAILDGANLTGTIPMHGANLSNASLRDADLSFAQMGALSLVFAIAQGESDFDKLKTALQNDDTDAVQTIFVDHGEDISGSITIIKSKFSDTSWVVEATAPVPKTFSVELETVGGVSTFDVYRPTTPALLANAFMVNVKLTSANMIGVNASGASLYAIDGKNPDLNSAQLQAAAFNNANLSNADFSSANLAGTNFDYATLSNAQFQHVVLATNAAGARASFNGANLQGANFDGATLSNVVFNNAAFGTEYPPDSGKCAGVWLFSIPAAKAPLLESELDGSGGRNQFTLPLSALPDLDTDGPVPTAIVSAFAKKDVTLTSGALLVTMNEMIVWRVNDDGQDFVIFQSYDEQDSRPALGVAEGTEYTPTPLFTIPLSLQSSLHNGTVESDIVAAFEKQGHPISASATISGLAQPVEWQIINGSPDYDVYSIWLDLSAGGTSLTARPAITHLIDAFAEYSYAITTRATVGGDSTGGWLLDNDSSNPFNPVKNYIIFRLIPDEASGGIDVYGSFLRIGRLSSAGEQEYFNIPVQVTKLTEAQMSSPGVVCPNGNFASTNKKIALPYAEWLRARVAPRPPLCVPDPLGMFYCPI